MIKRYLRQLLLASVVTLLPIAAGLVLWYELPPTLTTHWGASGAADGFASKSFVVIGVPLILLAVFWVCVGFTCLDPKNKDQNDKPLSVVFWIIPLISCVASGVIYATALGVSLSVNLLLGLVLGCVFAIIGNYMPKCKQNFTLGIKIRPTLESEENWNATHRLAGKLWVFSGFALILCGFLPEVIGFAAIMITVAVAVVVPVVYSFRYRRRQLQSEINDIQPVCSTPFGKTSLIITCVVVPLILIGLMVLMFTGSVSVTCEDTAFTVQATYWTGITVPYAEIDSVEYRTNFDFGSKTNGFNSARLMLGIYDNNEFGSYTVYAYTSCKEAIVLRDDQRVLVLACETAEQTKALYENLAQNIG